MAEKDDVGKKKGALDNFFPDAASAATDGSVSTGESGRLEGPDPAVEAAAMPTPAAKRVAANGRGEAEATAEVEVVGGDEVMDLDDTIDIEAVEATAEADMKDVRAHEDSAESRDVVEKTLAEDPLDLSEGEAASLSGGSVDELSPAEEVGGVPVRTDNEIVESLEESEERKSDILIGLGFNKYDDNDGKIKYSILEDGIKIGITFDEKNPDGYVWAIYHEDTGGYKDGTADEGKKGTFLSPVVRGQQPLLQRYYAILKGEEPIPKPVVVGKVVERRGNSIGIEFEEEVGGPRTEYYPATDAVKRDKDGFFIARGFSKEWRDRPAKMHFPRVIKLPNYEQEFGVVPVSVPSGQGVSKPRAGSASATASVGSGPSATPIASTPKWEVSKVPTVTLEEKKKQIASNLSWAVGEAVEAYKKHVEGQVPIEDCLGVFIEKVAVTAFISLQKSLRCVEG